MKINFVNNFDIKQLKHNPSAIYSNVNAEITLDLFV
jgi:hypothetical protein